MPKQKKAVKPTHAKLLTFVLRVAKMKTDAEFGEDGMPSDDAVDTVNRLIDDARELTSIQGPQE